MTPVPGAGCIVHARGGACRTGPGTPKSSDGGSAEANTGGGTSAGASGGENDASTKSLGYRKGMAIFTVAKGGLMYEATLGGQKYSYKPL